MRTVNAASAAKLSAAQKMDHITIFQVSLETIFLDRVMASDLVSAKAKLYLKGIELAKKIPAQDESDDQLRFLYQQIRDDKETLVEVLELDAKRQDILRRARKSATDCVITAYKKEHFDQSHSLASELRKCYQKEMKSEEVQSYMNQHFCAIFSLTGHPTNPNTVEYTAVGYQLDDVLALHAESDEVALQAVLDRVIATPLSGAKKTPQQEMAETKLALQKIRDSQKKLRADLQAAIDASPYATKLVLPEDLMQVAVWTHGGDADANSNMTAEVLAQGYADLEGFDATIDIRHDAGDLMKAVAAILKKNGISDFDKKTSAEQERILTDLLQDPSQIRDLMPDDAASAEIVKRLQVCGRNSGKTDKLIIANTKGANNALAALFLLRITGNKVAEEGATIDIVTLSESIEDLREIRAVQQALLANETYRRHLQYRRRIVQMIAKSDTFRVGGPGAEFDQDIASGQAYLLGLEAKEQYDLDLEIRVFSGGGAALQRGGGKPDEAANRQAKALLYVAEKSGRVGMKKGPTILTIQGHQQQLFCAEDCIYNAMEALMAQNLHSALIAEGKIASKENIPAEEARGEFCAAAVLAYQGQYFNNPHINELVVNANRAGVALGNLSSRPAKRGAAATAVAPGITFDDLSGSREGFNLFDTRAITLDRTLAHSGTFAVMFLGLREAFVQHNSEKMREAYKGSKGFRDFIRNQITVLYMVDSDHSWQMMIGEERPSREEITTLAAKFAKIGEVGDLKQRQKITMAYLDSYIHDVGKQIYQTFTGEIAAEDLELKTLLRLYSSELESEMRYREREARFAKIVEADFVSHGNEAGGEKLDKHSLDIARISYCGTDIASNAPVSMSAILTSMSKERSADGDSPAQSEVKVASLVERVEGRSQFPKCLTRVATNLQQASRRSVALVSV